MARRFNGTSDHILFTLSTILETLTAGDVTMVAVVDFNDVVDGALMHFRTSGGTNGVWMESSSGAWNFGQGVAARNVGTVAAADGWEILAARKIVGGANVPTGRRIVLGGSTTQVTAPSALADGTPPGAGGIFDVGKWGTASEFLSADIAALAIFKSVLSDATIDGFTTYAAMLAAGAAWIVHFNQVNPTDAITDDSGNGGGSATITGTTIVANPAGFFAGGSTVNAVLAATLPAPAAAAIAIPRHPAVLAATLPAPAAALAATPRVSAVLSATLSGPTAALAAKPTVRAVLQASLPAPAAALTARPRHLAVLQAILPAPAAAMLARAPVRAVLAAVLPAPIASIASDQPTYVTATLTPGAGAQATHSAVAAAGAVLLAGTGSAAALLPGAAAGATFTAGASPAAILTASTR